MDQKPCPGSASGIPVPVSRMRISAQSPQRRRRRRDDPHAFAAIADASAMAWAALTTMLRMTWLNSPGQTGHQRQGSRQNRSATFGDVFPFVPAHGQRGLDGAIEIDRHFGFGARMRKILHGPDDFGHAVHAFKACSMARGISFIEDQPGSSLRPSSLVSANQVLGRTSCCAPPPAAASNWR